MSALLQDPATHDSRPSAPTHRGTGRRCLPQPGSRSPGAQLRVAGIWPPLGTSAPARPMVVPLLSPHTAGASAQARWHTLHLPPPVPGSCLSEPPAEPGTSKPEAVFLVQVKMVCVYGLFHFLPTNRHPDTHLSSPPCVKTPPCAHTCPPAGRNLLTPGTTCLQKPNPKHAVADVPKPAGPVGLFLAGGGGSSLWHSLGGASPVLPLSRPAAQRHSGCPLT